jgi:predicted nucleic acid-binding Zn ribbon protein
VTDAGKPAAPTPKQVPDAIAAPASEGQRVWLRLRAVFGAPRSRRLQSEPKAGSLPYTNGRDPLRAATVLDGVTDALGWRMPLAQTDLTAAWRSIAGEETSKHAAVEGFVDGVLLVRCDSTAWATQLSLMRTQISERIAKDFPEAGVGAVRFLGPNTPSWNHGPRSVPGRGPRDTYG